MEFSEENVRIPFEQKELDGVLTVPADVSAGHCTAVVLTHGAGGDMHTKQLESLARALARSGVLCLRFTCRALNFLYRIRAYSAVVENHKHMLSGAVACLHCPKLLCCLFLALQITCVNRIFYKILSMS
ncbi:hypothetical protein G5714_010192 [Onychostoma macrolepis]|uniref:Testis expressed 30 n=1 Tax=Onychostoma macrolepis TaxID=369639 RepID=A0A7J6CP77_9TELE|nr:hypothetical protein G5714_010192 [Onychostoma macrolepis]